MVLAAAILLPPRSTAAYQQGLDDQLAIVSELDALGEYDRALQILRPLLRSATDDYILLCWMAEILLDKSEVILRDATPREAKPVCQEAVLNARRAAEVRPDGAEGWFQVGQTTGMLSQLPGGRETVDMAVESKVAFDRAISLDPDHTGAIHGLARWHYCVANLPWTLKLAAKIFYGGLPPAYNEEAVRLYRRAISLEPDVIIHHLELGKAYLEMKEKALARAEFETVLRLPAMSHFDTDRKQEARLLLSEMR
jgi:tetratricopeptide (TPR) repeat protein